jgi:hypothetical protein
VDAGAVVHGDQQAVRAALEHHPAGGGEDAVAVRQ